MDARTVMGYPIPLGQVCKIFPPTLEQVLNNQYYGTYIDLLTLTQEDIWDSIAEKEGEIPKKYPTPLQHLLNITAQSEDNKEVVKEAIKFFTNEDVRIQSEGGIILFTESFDQIQSLSQVRYISEQNYFAFQNLIRLSVGMKAVEAPAEKEDPRVALIKARARRRDRVKARQGAKKGGISLGDMLVALSCMDIGFSPLKQYGEMSYATVMEMFKVGQNKSKYETDVVFIAGKADPKKIKPKFWVGLED